MPGKRVVVLLALLAAGCGGSGPTGLATGGSGTVTLSVGPGVTPTISWSGGNAARLTITQSQGGGVFWDLQALNPQSGFASPVVHGVVPTDARELSADVQLTQGVDYRVTATMVNGTQGSLVFRP